MKLSILIPSTKSRQDMTDKLIIHLQNQCINCDVEILLDWHEDNCIGIKRNNLLSNAIGEYIVFVDSDDQISDNYVSEILWATKPSPDCIGINGTITTNGQNKRQWFISKEYGHWHEANGVYYRTPNHISPVKRELALQAGFPEITFGEDAEYSRRLLPFLKSEIIITQPIYHYDFWQK